MSVITPDSDLYLLHSPLEADMNHQMNFADATAQFTYFSGLPNSFLGEGFTYIRKDGYIKVEACMDDIITYNYLMYRNTAFGNKWFYAFINRMEYLSPNCTAIYFTVDPWQTWQFDITIRKCFVEREHVNDDTLGLHTIDEGLGTGEYIINSMTNKTICAPDVNGGWIVMAVTELPTYTTGTHAGEPIKPTTLTSRVYNGIMQGCFLMLFEYNSTGITTVSNVIDWYVNQGKVDAITSMYALPKSVYPSEYVTSQSYADPFTGDVFWLSSHTGATDMGSTTLAINANLNGYVPKNKKCFCYPFNYIMLTNNAGTNSVYRYEDFTTPSSVEFHYSGVVTEGSSVKAYPVNYKKCTTNYAGYAYGCDMGGTPTFSWNSDYYLNWKAQNSFKGWINSSANFWQPSIESSQGGAKDTRTGGQILQQGTEVVGSFFKAIGSILSIGQASKTPDQVNGESAGDVNFSIGRTGFTFYQMSVRAEVAQIIDDFFTVYGYKVNAVKVPNITGRTNWNYVKLNDANITGNIPQPDLLAIKAMFEKGVTIWHNPSTFMDYTQSNNIV